MKKYALLLSLAICGASHALMAISAEDEKKLIDSLIFEITTPCEAAPEVILQDIQAEIDAGATPALARKHNLYPLHQAIIVAAAWQWADTILTKLPLPIAPNNLEDAKAQLNLMPQIIKLLTRAGFDVNEPMVTAQNMTPLMFAIIFGAPKAIVKALLDEGADVNCTTAQGTNLLHGIVNVQSNLTLGIDAIKKSIDNRPIKELFSNVITEILSTVENQEQILQLVNSVVDPQTIGNLIKIVLDTITENLFQAYDDSVQLLIARGIDVNEQDAFGETPLYLATGYQGACRFTNALKAAGADRTIKSHYGLCARDLEKNSDNLLKFYAEQSMKSLYTIGSMVPLFVKMGLLQLNFSITQS